ncbi:DEAD/DEAH box helicase [Maricaulis sp.]|uniref:DEAD/DEAH box helicase n=1 Tax=Maricaulis sp. TaxID=1486257 RepID=UPI002602B0FC|nr:DEAD/DEAH box helicase [Maricaulis sp.]
MTGSDRIAPPLARALEARGYTALTEVQEAVLSQAGDAADLLVSAQTGSGKTVAFGLAIAPGILGETDQLGFAAEPLALIIAPTRELALQVQRELAWLYDEARGRIASCVGGMDPRAERRALERGCHIVVGTPGRLRDHIERRALDMSNIRAIVLDEADEMLDFGFKEDLEFILSKAPEERRTLMFSATVPPAIASLAREFQKDAQRISTIGEREQHVDIDYRIFPVAPRDREHAIINTLRFYDAERAIVFCSTREAVSRLTSRLGNRGFSTVALSGELSQSERTHALQAIRDGRARVCVATDVAARGIDLPGLELVIHADLPGKAETLLHRSGRTGRAGQKGTCVLIAPVPRKGKANRLLREAGVTAEWQSPPSQEAIRERDRERIFADPALTAESDEETLTDARILIETYGAETVAAAFLKSHIAALPAAEDLSPAPAAKVAERADFDDGVWFKLTAGRKHRAEPRWLLPLICRVGDVTRREIGAIRIDEDESYFEVTGRVLEVFEQALARAGGGEKNIRIERVVGDVPVPARGKPAYGRDDRDDDRGDRKPRRARPDRPDGDRPFKKREGGPAKGKDRPWKEDGPRKKGAPGKDERPAKPAARDRKPDAHDAHEGGAKPHWDEARPAPETREDRPKRNKPYGNKPKGKPAGKAGGKTFGKPGHKPKSGAPGPDDRPRRRNPSQPAETGHSLKKVKRKPKRD